MGVMDMGYGKSTSKDHRSSICMLPSLLGLAVQASWVLVMQILTPKCGFVPFWRLG